MVKEILAAFFEPVLKFLRELLGLTVLCTGGGCALTALALMEPSFLMLLIVVGSLGVFVIGLAISPVRSNNSGPVGYRQRLARIKQLKNYSND